MPMLWSSQRPDPCFLLYFRHPMPVFPDATPQTLSDASKTPSPPAKPRMSTRNRLLFFLTAWLIVLMPFLFWWNTWFGRQLNDKQLAEYLQDEKHPRHIQHALVQIAERMNRHDAGVTRWYHDAIRLASDQGRVGSDDMRQEELRGAPAVVANLIGTATAGEQKPARQCLRVVQPTR